MSDRASAWAWRQHPKTTSQKLVLMAVADRADEDGECWPSLHWISEKCAPMTERTVRRVITELAEQGFIAKAERRRRSDGSLGTWIYRLPLDDETPVATSGHLSPVATSGRTDLDLPDGELEPDGSKVRPGSGLPRNLQVVTVIEVWLHHAPPLISHRESYIEEVATRRSVERALKRYPAEVIAEAIANYAAVLGGDEFRWDYRWTIIDFLKRGLDRFVPEAMPLENFRVRAENGQKFGRRDVSAAEMLAAADRLDADQQRRELESG